MSSKPHLCIVSCQHAPDDMRVTHKEAMSFRSHGFRVSWVGPMRPRTGDDYGIEFHYYAREESRVKRLLKHHRSAFKLATEIDIADVYFAVEPDSASVAIKLAKRFGRRAIFDIHEVYDREMLSAWVPGFLLPGTAWAVRRKLQRLCEESDLVVGVSHEVLEPYIGPKVSSISVRNCAPQSFANADAAAVCAPDREHFRVMHGKSAIIRGTPVVIEAAGLALDRIPNLRIVIFDEADGSGGGWNRTDLESYARSKNALEALEIRSPVPFSMMPGILQSCDAGLIAYDRTWGVRSLPNRFFEYLATGLPVVAPIYAKEISPIVVQESCGLLVDAENPEELAQALVQLASSPSVTREMGSRGRRGFLARHTWEVEIEPLIQQLRAWAAEDHLLQQ
jgi:glycosyltransferase involved in cell wall biosynthesis